MNIGVASGKVLRGEIGCDVMHRFSMVGTLVCYGHARNPTAILVLCMSVLHQQTHTSAVLGVTATPNGLHTITTQS